MDKNRKKRSMILILGAAITSAFIGIFSAILVFRNLQQPTETVDLRNQKLITIGEYMLDKLHEGDLYPNTSFEKKELSEYIDHSKDSDVYNAVLFSDFSSISFLDEHTVMINNGAMFHSVSGYLITDGQKSYPNGFLELPGSGYDSDGIYIRGESDNIYSWSAGL